MTLHQHDCPWCDYRPIPAREASSRWNLERHYQSRHPERIRADRAYRAAIMSGRGMDRAARIHARVLRYRVGERAVPWQGALAPLRIVGDAY